MGASNSISRFLKAQSVLNDKIARTESWQIKQGWREVFATGLHEATKKWKLGNHDWHVFSHGYFPCILNEDARREYIGKVASDFYFFSSNEQLKNYV